MQQSPVAVYQSYKAPHRQKMPAAIYHSYKAPQTLRVEKKSMFYRVSPYKESRTQKRLSARYQVYRASQTLRVGNKCSAQLYIKYITNDLRSKAE